MSQDAVLSKNYFNFSAQATSSEEAEQVVKNIVTLKKDNKDVYPVTHNRALIGGYSNKAYNINDTVYLNDWDNVIDNGLYYSDTFAANGPEIDADVGPCNVFIRVSAIENQYVLQETVINNRFDYFPMNEDYLIGDEEYSGKLLGYLDKRLFRIGIYTSNDIIVWHSWQEGIEQQQQLKVLDADGFYYHTDDETSEEEFYIYAGYDIDITSEYDLNDQILFFKCPSWMDDDLPEYVHDVYFELNIYGALSMEIKLPLEVQDKETGDWTTTIPTHWMHENNIFAVIKSYDSFQLVDFGNTHNNSSTLITINRWEADA